MRLQLVGLLAEPKRAEGREMLLRVVSMLVKLSRTLETSGIAVSKHPNDDSIA